MKRQPIIILLILFFVIPVSASTPADGAFGFVSTSVDKVLTILRNPAFKEESTREIQRQKLRTVVEAFFNYNEISMRTLGRNRKSFTPVQMDEFSDLFTRLLEKIYLNRIREYSDEKVIYGKATMLSENKAEVETTVVTASKQIPINYRVVLKYGEWRGYDVIIEGVSLVRNYRSQFNKILQKKTPEDLLQQLREKVNEKEVNAKKTAV
ncbi:MAG: ABC transporter substrate-binding protein [Deltaproteobacteria bacterium]|nr:ABC transporter substrate-binding protein [Deltaproteobacteria bacterium]MBW2080916.1 ABC transporter substrate-binding protein [Deltaproteobacteria bacterium]